MSLTRTKLPVFGLNELFVMLSSRHEFYQFNSEMFLVFGIRYAFVTCGRLMPIAFRFSFFFLLLRFHVFLGPRIHFVLSSSLFYFAAHVIWIHPKQSSGHLVVAWTQISIADCIVFYVVALLPIRPRYLTDFKTCPFRFGLGGRKTSWRRLAPFRPTNIAAETFIFCLRTTCCVYKLCMGMDTVRPNNNVGFLMPHSTVYVMYAPAKLLWAIKSKSCATRLHHFSTVIVSNKLFTHIVSAQCTHTHTHILGGGHALPFIYIYDTYGTLCMNECWSVRLIETSIHPCPSRLSSTQLDCVRLICCALRAAPCCAE